MSSIRSYFPDYQGERPSGSRDLASADFLPHSQGTTRTTTLLENTSKIASLD